MNKDLTVGKPEQVLWKFSLPLFVSVIFQQLYNIADSIIAGKFAGEDALAAVGASYPITMIFMAIALGSNIGCSIVVSRLFGAKDYKNMKTAISTSIIAALILSVVLTLGGIIGSIGMLKLLKTPDNIMKDGALYLRIYIGGFAFVCLYNIATGIFQALGDSQTPLFLLIGSSVGNILLDLLFVAVFHWGVGGVAWATFIAQGIACVFSLYILSRRIKGIKVDGSVPVFSGGMLKQIGYLAIPSILQQSFVSVGNLFIQGLVNSYGSSVIAGYSAAVKLNTIVTMSFTTLGNGVSSFTAQNCGAGKTERVKKGCFAGCVMAIIVTIPFFAAYFFFGSTMINLFMDSDESITAINTGVTFLRIVSPFYAVVAIKLILDGMYRGMGKMGIFMTMTFTDLIVRVILAYIFSPIYGSKGIWMSWPVGWCASLILYLIIILITKIITNARKTKTISGT